MGLYRLRGKSTVVMDRASVGNTVESCGRDLMNAGEGEGDRKPKVRCKAK